MRSYLNLDLSVRCDGSSEHAEVLAVAWPMVVLWPIGMVAGYAALLAPCRSIMLEQSAPSPLLHATSFLHRDYKPE
eukprot:142608-Prymnesium_polylepis.1